MDDDFYSAYHRPDPTVFEDYGPAEIDTGLLDPSGRPIFRPNPNVKMRIGFHSPTLVTPGARKL